MSFPELPIDGQTPWGNQFRAWADAVEAASGAGGVTEVSGTVTLPADGPRVVQMYTTASTVINGETFGVDTALVARRTAAGVWQVAAVSENVWTGATGTVTVTPTAPTFTDLANTANDTYTIPSQAGVVYKIAGNTVAAGTYPGTGTVSITASAATGHTLSGTISWAHTFSTAGGPTPVAATAPTFTDDTINGGGTWTTPTITGVTYSPASGAADPSESITVNATAQEGYTLTGPSSWTHEFPAATPPWQTVVFSDTFTDTDGVNLGSHTADTAQTWTGATLSSIIHSNRLRCAASAVVWAEHGIPNATPLRGEFTYHTAPSDDGPLFICFRGNGTTNESRLGIFISRESTRTIVQWQGSVTTTFNNGNGANPWCFVPGADFSLAQTFEFAIEYTASTITVFCDGVKILAGTHSFSGTGTHLSLASSTSSWTPAGTGGLDGLKVLTA